MYHHGAENQLQIMYQETSTLTLNGQCWLLAVTSMVCVPFLMAVPKAYDVEAISFPTLDSTT